MKTLLVSLIFIFVCAVACYAGEYKTTYAEVYDFETGSIKRVEITTYVPTKPEKAEASVIPGSLDLNLGLDLAPALTLDVDKIAPGIRND